MFTLLSWWFIPNHSNTSCHQKEINHHVWETPYGCLTFYRIPWSHLRPKYYHTSCRWRQTLPEGGLATSQPLIFGNGFLCFFHMVCLVFSGLYCHFPHFSISLYISLSRPFPTFKSSFLRWAFSLTDQMSMVRNKHWTPNDIHNQHAKSYKHVLPRISFCHMQMIADAYAPQITISIREIRAKRW